MVIIISNLVLKDEENVFREVDESHFGYHMIEGPEEYLVEMPSEETKVWVWM